LAQHESRRCSRDTYPESYTTKYTSIRRIFQSGSPEMEKICTNIFYMDVSRSHRWLLSGVSAFTIRVYLGFIWGLFRVYLPGLGPARSPRGRSQFYPSCRAARRAATRSALFRKVDVRLPGKGNSNSHGARPVHRIITMIKLIRTSRQ